MTFVPSFQLSNSGPISEAFISRGIDGFKEAAYFVRSIPYGRTKHSSDLLSVLNENSGTCSSKHALLATLARENKQPVSLMLGIYEMNAENTKGIESVMNQHSISCIPEAHCYLSYSGDRLDFTRLENPITPETNFLLEEEIRPEQYKEHKVKRHKEFIKEWCSSTSTNYKPEEIWTIREECIANLV